MFPPSSPDLVSSYKQQYSVLQAENAQLRAEREALVRLACQTISLLEGQDDDSRPDGIWIRAGDQEYWSKLEGGGFKMASGKVWTWQKIRRVGNTSTSLAKVNAGTKLSSWPYYFPPPPPFPYDSELASNEPREAVVPFTHSFPLEILEHIVGLCDTRTMSIIAKSNLACLNLFAPKLLEVASTKGRYGGYFAVERLASLFTRRDAASSSRLANALSLEHIRVLEVRASSLQEIEPWQIFTSRMSRTPLLLSRLTISLDFDSLDYDRGRPRVACFRPRVELLSLLDPEKLVFEGNPDTLGEERSYRITRAASSLISNWSRLRSVDLLDVDLWVLPETFMDQTDMSENHSILRQVNSTSFFLGLGGHEQDPSSTESNSKWSVRWFTSSLAPFDGRYIDIAHQLVERDRSLVSERLESATVVVGSEASATRLRNQIRKYEEKQKGSTGCLKVVVAPGLRQDFRGLEGHEALMS